ncbi:hypothetical protein BH09MYX1_BH09MYX1_13250 [soil metagenome]
MNGTLFEIKHAHLSGLRLGRVFTEPLGLTPARVDMLRAILERPGRGISQSQLRRSLSVTKTVISVMVRALERLGFVKRVPHRDDGRTYWVTLTALGEESLRKIFYTAVTQGFLRIALVGALLKLPIDVKNQLDLMLSRLEAQLLPFREAFGIGTHNPWEANEDDESFYYADVPDNPNAVDLVSREDEVSLRRACTIADELKWRDEIASA